MPCAPDPALLRDNPQIELDLKVDDGGPDLAQEGIDVAIRFGPLGGQPGLVSMPLGSFPWVLCATPKYVEVMGRPVSPAELAAHHQIGYRNPANGQLVTWQFADPDTGAIERIVPRHRLIVEDMSAVWQMMRQGLGLAWLPAWVGMADMLEGRAVELLQAWRIAETPIQAVRLDRRQTPRRVRTLLDSLALAAKEWRIS